MRIFRSHEAGPMSAAPRVAETPAEAAANLLIRLGLATLFVGLPCSGVFWRGAIYVLLPVGAILVLTGALLHAPVRRTPRLPEALSRPASLTAVFVGSWAA